MGRVTSYTEYDTMSETPTVAVYSRTAVYNNKSQLTSDQVTVVRTDGTWVSSTTYDYKADSNSDGDYIDAGDQYMGGVLTHQRTVVTKNGSDTAAPDTDSKNTFVWWDGARQATTTYDKDVGDGGNALWVSTYNYDGSGNLQQVYIADGTPRTLGFVTDADGFIIARDEVYNAAGNSPHERHYYFNGMAVGDIGNNGTSDIDYAASIARHTQVPGTGKFLMGATSGTLNADFDQSYDPINGLNYANTAAHYTVQDGDTLASIAYQIWGDSSYWYLIADANGLSGDETLTAGQNLIIPNKVHNSHNSADTYRVYDPNEAIGDTSPTHRKPPKRPHAACGGFGQILVTIIAVAVTAIIAPYLTAALGGVLGGAIAGAAGSLVGQGAGLALGIQSKLDWSGVAMAAISGGVNGGLAVSGVFSGLGPVGDALRGITASVLTQGIGVATGLQSKFDWAGVAASGISSGVMGWVGNQLQASGASPMAINVVSGAAGLIANAATRTLINGSDFGDNILAALPDTIANTIGNMIARGMAQSNQMSGAEYQARMNQYNAALDNGATPDQLQALYYSLGLDTVTAGAAPLGAGIQVNDLPPIPGYDDMISAGAAANKFRINLETTSRTTEVPGGDGKTRYEHNRYIYATDDPFGKLSSLVPDDANGRYYIIAHGLEKYPGYLFQHADGSGGNIKAGALAEKIMADPNSGWHQGQEIVLLVCYGAVGGDTSSAQLIASTMGVNVTATAHFFTLTSRSATPYVVDLPPNSLQYERDRSSGTMSTASPVAPDKQWVEFYPPPH